MRNNKKGYDGNRGKEAARRPKENGLPNGLSEVVSFRGNTLYHYIIAQINDKPKHSLRKSFRYHPGVKGSRDNAIRDAKKQRASWVKKFYNNQKSKVGKGDYKPRIRTVKVPANDYRPVESTFIEARKALHVFKMELENCSLIIADLIKNIGVSTNVWLILRAIWILEYKQKNKWVMDIEVAGMVGLTTSEVAVLAYSVPEYIHYNPINNTRNLTPLGCKLVRKGLRILRAVDKH
jgi:hypothetical protein